MFERLKNALGAGSTKLELDGLTQWVTEHMLAYRAPGSGLRAPGSGLRAPGSGLRARAVGAGGVLEGHLLDRPGDSPSVRYARDVFEHLSARALHLFAQLRF